MNTVIINPVPEDKSIRTMLGIRHADHIARRSAGTFAWQISYNHKNMESIYEERLRAMMTEEAVQSYLRSRGYTPGRRFA